MTDEKKQRTTKQNAALHLWLDRLSDALNDAGHTLGDGVVVRLPISFSKDNLKENVLRPYMRALWPEYRSTTQLSTAEIQRLYKELDAIISERTGVTVGFPSEEELREMQDERLHK